MNSGKDESDCKSQPDSVKILFKNEGELSSLDIPRDEWSSLLVEQEETNLKRIQYADGLYNPGSGEICTKYLSLSASSVLRHPFYKYPGVIDPGIEEALLGPPRKITYSDDGQELYLALCKEMSIAPIRVFYTSLLTSKVDLSYYGVSTKGFRAISLALKCNMFVEVLDLTDNWMNTDACFHLGEMLRENNHITELILKGCRIKPCGAEVLFHHLAFNRKVFKLDVSRNELEDKGVEYLAKAIFLNPLIVNINLSYNKLTADAVLTLVDLFEIRNKVTHLDLSWNSIITSEAIYKLCFQLKENSDFKELNLSWNSLSTPRIGLAIKLLLVNAKSIETIILSNNKLSDLTITYLGSGLAKAKNLKTLDLSYNPLSPRDALLLLKRLESPLVKLKHLLLDDVVVEQKFVSTRDEILSLDYRENTVITHGYVRPGVVYYPEDIRYILIKRANAIGRSTKKKVDFALAILEMFKDDPTPIAANYFIRALKIKGLNLGDEMNEQIATYFPGPLSTDKKQAVTVNLGEIVDYIKRLWPDKKLPPEEEVIVIEKKKKDNKKKDNKQSNVSLQNK